MLRLSTYGLVTISALHLSDAADCPMQAGSDMAPCLAAIVGDAAECRQCWDDFSAKYSGCEVNDKDISLTVAETRATCGLSSCMSAMEECEPACQTVELDGVTQDRSECTVDEILEFTKCYDNALNTVCAGVPGIGGGGNGQSSAGGSASGSANGGNASASGSGSGSGSAAGGPPDGFVGMIIPCYDWVKERQAKDEGVCEAELSAKGEAAMYAWTVCVMGAALKNDAETGASACAATYYSDDDDCDTVLAGCAFKNGYDKDLDNTNELENFAMDFRADAEKENDWFECMDKTAGKFQLTSCLAALPKLKLAARPKVETDANTKYIGKVSVVTYATQDACQNGGDPVYSREEFIAVPKADDQATCMNEESYDEGNDSIMKGSVHIECVDPAAKQVKRTVFQDVDCSGVSDESVAVMNECMREDGMYMKITWADGFCGGETTSTEVPADQLTFQDYTVQEEPEIESQDEEGLGGLNDVKLNDPSRAAPVGVIVSLFVAGLAALL